MYVVDVAVVVVVVVVVVACIADIQTKVGPPNFPLFSLPLSPSPFVQLLSERLQCRLLIWETGGIAVTVIELNDGAST